MDATTAEIGRNPVSKHQIQPEGMEMSRLTRNGTAEPVSRDQILRRERRQGKIHFPCSVLITSRYCFKENAPCNNAREIERAAIGYIIVSVFPWEKIM